MSAVVQPWGATALGDPVTKVELENDDLRVVLVSYGARLAELDARRADLTQARAAILASRAWRLSRPLPGSR